MELIHIQPLQVLQAQLTQVIECVTARRQVDQIEQGLLRNSHQSLLSQYSALQLCHTVATEKIAADVPEFKGAQRRLPALWPTDGDAERSLHNLRNQSIKG